LISDGNALLAVENRRNPEMAAGYESDHTRFMRELLAKNPEWVEEQQRGRALWWERKTPADAADTFSEGRKAHHAYPYDVNFKQP